MADEEMSDEEFAARMEVADAFSRRSDSEVLALCERIGFGAVMGSASRQWIERDPVGALTVGDCKLVVDRGGWSPIETAPHGNDTEGPFFDVIWADEDHRYLPVPRREIDCYSDRGVITRQHGYPAIWTVFTRPPTHWRPSPSRPALL